MLVSSIMSRHVVSILPDDTIESAARLLAHHNIGALPVCDASGRLKGVITDRDVAVRAVACDMSMAAMVKGVMSKAPVSVLHNADVREAAEIMSTHKIRRLPVVNGDSVIGMISLGDIAKSGEFRAEIGKILGDISVN